jgi:hypothetical protein
LGGVSVVAVSDRGALKRFIRLPCRLHAGNAHFVAPLEREQLRALAPGGSPGPAPSEAQCFLASRDGRDVGRIAAKVDARQSGVGQFGLLASEDDPAVFAALFAAAEDWLRKRGSTLALGPLPIVRDFQPGLLVRGFNTPPMVFMPHDPPFAAFRVQEQGYARARDAVACLYDTRRELPAGMRRLLARRHGSLRLRSLDMRSLDVEFELLAGIWNEACGGQWPFEPPSADAARQMAGRLRPLIDPALTAVVELRGQPIGFCIALLNRNELTRDFGGRLLPLNSLRLLWRSRKGPGTARVPLLCIRPGERGLLKGIIPLLLIEQVLKGARVRGIRDVELSPLPEDNRPMRRIAQALGCDPYKTFRLYQKDLT